MILNFCESSRWKYCVIFLLEQTIADWLFRTWPLLYKWLFRGKTLSSRCRLKHFPFTGVFYNKQKHLTRKIFILWANMHGQVDGNLTLKIILFVWISWLFIEWLVDERQARKGVQTVQKYWFYSLCCIKISFYIKVLQVSIHTITLILQANIVYTVRRTFF